MDHNVVSWMIAGGRAPEALPSEQREHRHLVALREAKGAAPSWFARLTGAARSTHAATTSETDLVCCTA
jgi:hypothetical protein